MQAKMASWLLSRKQLAGVECFWTEEGYRLQVVVLAKKKGEASIVQQAVNLRSWDELKALLPKDCPIFFGWNSPKLIFKSFERAFENKEQALKTIFPSAKAADILVEFFPKKEGQLVVLGRREELLNLLNLAKEAGLPIVYANYAPFVATALFPYLEEDRVAANHYEFFLEDGALSKLFKQEGAAQLLNLGGEQLDSRLLAAAALAFIGLEDVRQTALDIPLLKDNQERLMYKKLLELSTALLLSFFFISLLANYLYLGQLEQENESLSLEVAQKQQLIAERDRLREDYEQQVNLGAGASLGEKSQQSFYADQLASSLPKSIHLLELEIAPLLEDKKAEREGKAPNYQQGLIRIKGISKKSVFYNDWKKSLQALSWVERIDDISYQNIDHYQATFELMVICKKEGE